MGKNCKFRLCFVANIEATASRNRMANERIGVDEVSSFKEIELGSRSPQPCSVCIVLEQSRGEFTM